MSLKFLLLFRYEMKFDIFKLLSCDVILTIKYINNNNNQKKYIIYSFNLISFI